MKLNEFMCQLHLFDSSNDDDNNEFVETVLEFKVRNFQLSHLLLEFRGKNDSKEIKMFKKHLSENPTNIEFGCSIKSPKGLEINDFILQTVNKKFSF